MSYHLSVSGHHQGLSEEEHQAAEQALFDEIQAVVSKPEHGVSQSSFHSQHVHGDDLHYPAAEHEHIHETGDVAAEQDAAAEASQDTGE